MKVKHLLIGHFILIALAIGVFFMSGCATKMTSLTNPCVFNAKSQALNWHKQGADVRLGRGTYKDKGHMWCERRIEDGGEWVLCNDTTKANSGHPIAYYKSYKVRCYSYPYLMRFHDYR